MLYSVQNVTSLHPQTECMVMFMKGNIAMWLLDQCMRENFLCAMIVNQIGNRGTDAMTFHCFSDAVFIISTA